MIRDKMGFETRSLLYLPVDIIHYLCPFSTISSQQLPSQSKANQSVSDAGRSLHERDQRSQGEIVGKIRDTSIFVGKRAGKYATKPPVILLLFSVGKSDF